VAEPDNRGLNPTCRDWTCAPSKEIALPIICASRALYALRLRPHLSHDGNAFGPFTLPLELAASLELEERIFELGEIGLSPRHHVADDDRRWKAWKVAAARPASRSRTASSSRSTAGCAMSS